MDKLPRMEHPNPQFERQHWRNLNGVWNFEIDYGVSGEARGMADPNYDFQSKILVPFCPESKLSGIGNTDFLNCVWYKRAIQVSSQDLTQRIVLHFGAVDHECTLFVNGVKVGTHRGGYISFSFEISEYLHEGENVLTVCAKDDIRNPLVARGKQSERYHSHDCDYTRTTGIWQTVWLEYTPKHYVECVRYYPNSTDSTVQMELQLHGSADVKVEVFYENRFMGSKQWASCGGTEYISIDLLESHLWEVGCGRLYDVVLTFGDDVVRSYFGLRNIQLQNRKFLLN